MRRERTEAKGESGRESKRKKERGEKTEVMGTKDRERGMMKREEKKTGETAKEFVTERRKK